MAVSRFELSGKRVEFLDLSDPGTFIKRFFHLKNEETIANSPKDEYLKEIEVLLKKKLLPGYLNVYPLLAACYIQGCIKDATFKPEYIFPQLIMQWMITKDDINGVQYESTKCKPPESVYYNQERYLNFAIPIKSYDKSGHCEILKKNITLTAPITWELLSIMNPKIISNVVDYKSADYSFPLSPINKIKLDEDNLVDYRNSSFGIMERELFTKRLKTVQTHDANIHVNPDVPSRTPIKRDL